MSIINRFVLKFISFSLSHVNYNTISFSLCISYQRKLGVIITKIVQENNTVGVVIEGGYLARAFLLGQMNSNYLNLFAQQSKTDLHLLIIKGKFWNKQKVISALPSPFELNDVHYLVSKTTKEAGSGVVLLFTALQL